MSFLTIKYNSTDYSKKLKDYGTASAAIELQTGEYIYVGYEKPFNQFFVELETKNSNGGLMTAEYYDGSVWQPLNTLLDESEDFTKSGFFIFDKPYKWASTEVDSVLKFYIRLKTDTSHSVGVKIKGVAMLLSNDLDLEGVRSNIVSKFNNGSSWVLKHEQARKDIIQLLRNRGNRKVSNADKNNPLATEAIKFSDINEYDLLAPEQLRQASLYKTLSMIYLDELSDDEGDKWERQGLRYERTFNEMFNLFSLQIDSDDDGLLDDGESYITTSTALTWH